MLIKQISIFVENKPGRLSAVTKLLSDNGIDIRALSVADTKDFGILRLIVNNPTKACEVLKEADCTVSLTNVIAIGIHDKPGGLSAAMDCLYSANISVEYMYACVGKTTGKALMVIRVENPQAAEDVLAKEGFAAVNPGDIYRI